MAIPSFIQRCPPISVFPRPLLLEQRALDLEQRLPLAVQHLRGLRRRDGEEREEEE